MRKSPLYCYNIIVELYPIGYGGLMFGSVAKPYEPNVGAEGAAFGLIGMNLVELIQAWRLIDNPHKPLFKLMLITTISLTTGFIPQVGLVCFSYL